MKNYIIIFALTLVGALGINSQARASHVSGGDFQYECIGQDSFLITLNLFRDCAGISAPTTVSVAFSNSCGQVLNATLSQTAVSGTEVSFLCGSMINLSSCNNGSLPGMEIYQYQAIVVFPSSCAGELQAVATGGTPGYNFSWPGGYTGPSVDNLCAGTYDVTVTDDNGCTVSDTITLAGTGGLGMTLSSTPVSCGGVCDGSITVSASGGTTPYTYYWSNGMTGATNSNLCAGLYTITVMDANRRQHRYTTNLGNPTPVFTSFQTTPESCAGANDAFVMANTIGGNGSYSYAWSDPSLNGPLNPNIAPGTYTVTVTDANGCSGVNTVVVPAASPINTTVTQNSIITCFGACTGELVASVSGGIAPYTYQWSNGSTNTIINQLCAGNYSLTVTDVNGCVDVVNYNLTQPSPIVSNPSITLATCGSSNGAVTLAPTGGAGSYSYTWSTTNGSGNVATSLAAGSYLVTITDINGCSIVETIGINNTTGPTGISFVTTSPSCAGDSNGVIVATPIGGSAPYTYLWSTGSTSNTVNNLPAGEYTVVVTDANGCKRVTSTTLTDPVPITLSTSSSNVTCFNLCDGTVSVTPAGGTPPYAYSWNTGATGGSLSSLCDGSYTVTVTDAGGCSVIQSFTIVEPTLLSDSLSIDQEILCNGDSTGQITAHPIGGTAPYSYAWNTGSTVRTLFQQGPGTYIVTITDASGCSVVDTATLTQPGALGIGLTILANPGCSGSWDMSWTTCCRNSAITNITGPGGASIWVGASMNTAFQWPDCNSGVEFEQSAAAHPMRYACIGDSICYNLGAVEPDGDSLFFEFIAAKTSATATVTYATGYSAAVPIPGITLDSLTGEVCFVANTVGNFVVTVKVTEYDPVSGLWKGENWRDIQFIVLNCPANSKPYNTGISNLQGGAGVSLVDPNSIEVCEGDSFCFDVIFYDSNLVDTNMYIFSNAPDICVGPGAGDTATITSTVVDSVFINGDTLLRITATMCWLGPVGVDGLHQFYIGVNDEHCTVPKDDFWSMDINVIGATNAGPDQTICGNQTALLNATGGSSFTWTSIAGDPIIIGQNFSCDTCATTIASPSQTTTYVVTSNLSSTCQNMDTVTINVANNFNVNAGPDTITCTVDSIQLYANPSVAGSYSFAWSYGNTMDDDTIQTPMAAPLVTTQYSVTVSSSQGCIKTGSVVITRTPPFPGLVTGATDTILCDADTTDIGVYLGNNIPTSCGGSQVMCLGSTYNANVGTSSSSNSQSSFPAPFGNARRTLKHQFLYQASELTTAGFSAGMITGLGFNVTALNGSTSTYKNYTIKMKCTNLTSLPYQWQTGMTTVMAPTTVNILTGWNMLSFTTPYNWDGTSNIVVEVCFDNSTSSPTQNASTALTATTTFVSSIYYGTTTATQASACGSSSITSAALARPHTRFEFCGQADSTYYNFAWSPSNSLLDSNLKNTQAFPQQTTTYTVTVGDTLGICEDTASITLYVSELDAGPDTLICEGDSIQLQPTVTQSCPSGGGTFTWSPTTGLNNPNIQNPIASVTQTRTYTLTYQDSCSCQLVDSVTIFVNNMNEPQTIIDEPECGLNDGEITIVPQGGTAPFLYSLDGGLSYQASNLFSNLGMGYYTSIYMDSNGCVSPIHIDTVINPSAPVVDSINTVDLSCFQAGDGEIEIFASGVSQPLTYSIDGGTTYASTGLFTGLDSGWYEVVVRDDSLCVTFPIDVYLDMNSEIVIDSIYLSNLNCFGDESGRIEVSAYGGTAPLTYTINNGVTYQGSNIFDSLDAGGYLVTVKDSKNCVLPAVPVQLVEPAQLIAIVATDTVSCFGQADATASAQITGGTVPYNITWSKTSVVPNVTYPTTGSTLANIDAGGYLFNVVDINGCEENVGFTITQPSRLQIDSIRHRNVTCNGVADGLISVYGQGGVPPYRYSVDNGTTWQSSYQFPGMAAGAYNVWIEDVNGCQAAGSVVLSEPSAVTLTVPFIQDSICQSNCINIAATASGGSGNYTYIWNNGLGNASVHNVCPTAPRTSYLVYAQDQNGCISNTQVINIDIYPALQVNAGEDIDICPGDTAWLQATASGGMGINYRFEWSPLSALDNPFASSTMATPNSTTTYTVRLSDQCGSPAVTDQVTVTVNVIPDVDFHATDTLKGCEPFDATLISDANPVQFAWWTIGEDITATGFVADIADLDAGLYDVTLRVRSPQGCEAEITKENYIDVKPLPTANFTFSPEETSIFNTLVRAEDVSRGQIVNWSWNFNDLFYTIEQNPSFQFPADTGSFPISLEVTSNFGCKDDTTQYVRIGDEYNMYIPNSFTPNGDNLNDVFKPVAIGIQPESYLLRIFNRWGELIFESTDMNYGWDGTYNGGEPAQNGSYVWKIIVNESTDESKGREYSGQINLIR